MSKENILYALIGVGFGLFFGFAFVAWANQRAAQPRLESAPATADSEAAADAPQQSSLAHGDQQQLEQVLQDATKRARAQQDDFEAQMDAGRINYQAKRYDDALEFYLKANQLRPAEVEPVIQLGNVNFDAGHYEAAERWYTAALVKEPDNVNVRTDLGLTFFERQPPDYERAIAEFRRSLERDPRHEQTLQNLAVVLLKKGDKAGARTALQQLQAVNPANPALEQLRAGLE